MKARLLTFFIVSAALSWADPGSEFLYGASVYPELQTRPEWNRMLDQLQAAHVKAVRVAESSWGNLETAPGKYNFGWLIEFLDDVQSHHMKAILGTSTYIAPQWLIASNPEMLRELNPGVKVHPMGRKAASIDHPAYRAACRSYIEALGRAFKDNPAVIGWQLDNEIEPTAGQISYDPAGNRAWHSWLQKTYHSAEEFNRRLLLVSWGMNVDSLEQVPQVSPTVDPPGKPEIPALRLANWHFRRDDILDFLAEQRETLLKAGVKQWITTDWMDFWTVFADDPLASKAVDIAGLNFYQPTDENPRFWTNLAWHLDMHRSAQGNDHFLVTETRAGVAGSAFMWDDFPSPDQFRMWMLQPAAYGASGLLFWSANRWRGGHWPHWGGLLDWSGNTEIDFPSYVQLGEFFSKYGARLANNPVQVTAAVLTDFDQRAALDAYPHTPASRTVLPESFDALHRLGIGTDAINSARAADANILNKYKLVILAAATALDGEAIPGALQKFVEAGGNVLITPFTAYQSWDGVFRGDGFGANLRDLSGALVRTARRVKAAVPDNGVPHARWNSLPQFDTSPIGVDGYCEVLETGPETKVIARFENMEGPLEGKPAATLRRLGKGSVIKLAFWPKDDSVLALIHQLLPARELALGAPLPRQIQAVPRQDNSLFVINTSASAASFSLSRSVKDVLSGRQLSGRVALKKFEVLWLE